MYARKYCAAFLRWCDHQISIRYRHKVKGILKWKRSRDKKKNSKTPLFLLLGSPLFILTFFHPYRHISIFLSLTLCASVVARSMSFCFSLFLLSKLFFFLLSRLLLPSKIALCALELLKFTFLLPYIHICNSRVAMVTVPKAKSPPASLSPFANDILL